MFVNFLNFLFMQVKKHTHTICKLNYRKKENTVSQIIQIYKTMPNLLKSFKRKKIDEILQIIKQLNILIFFVICFIVIIYLGPLIIIYNYYSDSGKLFSFYFTEGSHETNLACKCANMF